MRPHTKEDTAVSASLSRVSLLAGDQDYANMEAARVAVREHNKATAKRRGHASFGIVETVAWRIKDRMEFGGDESPEAVY